MNNQNNYPWLATQWQQLINNHRQARLAQANLLVGIAGLGKLGLAKNFASFLLCQNSKDEQACGQCRDCHLLQAQNHPDFLLLQPEEVGKALSIAQIRNLINTVSQTTHSDHYRVIIIEPAEAMSLAAANALLKTLEEPNAKTHFFLVSHDISLLPVTLRSRCQIIHCSLLALSQGLLFLQQQVDLSVDYCELALKVSGGAPLQALELIREEKLAQRSWLLQGLGELAQDRSCPTELAAGCLKLEALLGLDWLISWVNDLIRLNSALGEEKLSNQDFAAIMRTVAKKINQISLFDYLDKLILTRMQLKRKVNLNNQLLWENLLCSWYQLAR